MVLYCWPEINRFCLDSNNKIYKPVTAESYSFYVDDVATNNMFLHCIVYFDMETKFENTKKN